jgi:hypothetical protein
MCFVVQESGASDQNVKADASASDLAAAAAGAAVPSAGEAAAVCDPLNETCPPSGPTRHGRQSRQEEEKPLRRVQEESWTDR